MNALISVLGVMIAVSLGVWSALASWLSARGLILVRTELMSYGLCFFGVFVGSAMHFWAHGNLRPNRRVRFICSSLVLIAPLMVVLWTWVNSQKLFLFWKMKAIPANAWQQIISDLQIMAQSPPHSIVRGMPIPKSFAQLGREGEFNRADTLNLETGGYGAYVQYGNKVRRWGVLVGPKQYTESAWWSKYRRIDVGTNACFFIGSDA